VFLTGWKQVRLWVLYNGGTVSATMNGEKMTPVMSYPAGVNGQACVEQEFALETENRNGRLTFGMNCGSSKSVIIFNYCIAFY